MHFDIKAVLHFVAVAEDMSFTRAARRLGIAQPWLSRRIRQLEEQLGFALFERTTRSIELTARGRGFLDAARAVASAVEAATGIARALGRDAGGRLRIGAPPYSARIPARARIISGFVAQYPGTALEIDIGWTPVLIERVLAGELDATFGIGWQVPPGLIVRTLCHLAVELLMPEDDPLAASGGLLEPGALAGRRVGVFPRGIYPELHERLFQPLADRGAVLVQDAEFLDRALDAGSAAPGQPMIARFTVAGGALPAAGSGRRILAGPAGPFLFLARADNRTAALDRLLAVVGP
ncbi:MAG: LysR family transcriptional regulator [Zavarzinia sp.]|nr:LysR family transcriptional regulator [Zavarzinia sp.]